MNQVVNIKEKFKLFDEFWSPRILGTVNDHQVKIFKGKGELVWHQHKNEDEFFLVIRGSLTIKLEGQDEVTIREGEFFIVPKGVEHCPFAEDEVHVLLFEPKGVINTGQVENELTKRDLEEI